MSDEREKAEKFCREQLAIMDGSFEAGIKRIGTERFEKMVRDVMKSMPMRSNPAAPGGGK